jgi:hypothetical protein
LATTRISYSINHSSTTPPSGRNPDLVQAGQRCSRIKERWSASGDTKGFGVLNNPSESDYASARNVFAVIDSDRRSQELQSACVRIDPALSAGHDGLDQERPRPSSRISAAGYAGA